MVLRAEYKLHHSDLGRFLSEPVWEEQNGSALSLLSAFARLGMDPWEEAARLAAMQPDAAAAALAESLALLPPSGETAPTDHLALARRLADNLPMRHVPDPPAKGGRHQAKPGKLVAGALFLLGLLAAVGLLITIGQLILD
jgi:hypothetical protein